MHMGLLWTRLNCRKGATSRSASRLARPTPQLIQPSGRLGPTRGCYSLTTEFLKAISHMHSLGSACLDPVNWSPLRQFEIDAWQKP